MEDRLGRGIEGQTPKSWTQLLKRNMPFLYFNLIAGPLAGVGIAVTLDASRVPNTIATIAGITAGMGIAIGTDIFLRRISR